MIEDHIDAQWFRQSLIEDTLAPWLKAAPAENGFFRANLDRQWRPAAKQEATLVSQGRLLYVMAAGYELTGDKAYKAALVQGADFLLNNFADARHGGWHWSVGPDGKPIDPAGVKTAYGQVFAMFGLAHAGRVSGEERFTQAALDAWRTIKTKMLYPGGGLKPGTTADFATVVGTNNQNPMMHLFEALLTLHDATGSPDVLADARALAEFIYTRMYNSAGGYLAEMYDTDWRPLPTDKGGYIDIGHQFEWAYLLSWAVMEKGFDAKYLEIGRRLLDFGMAAGFDKDSGGIFSRCDYQGRHLGGAKGWWQQCEHLRAVMRYAGRHGRADLWPAFDKSLRLAREHFIDPQFHGWYGAYDPARERTEAESAKGSVWMVGYHVTGMHVEALKQAKNR